MIAPPSPDVFPFSSLIHLLLLVHDTFSSTLHSQKHTYYMHARTNQQNMTITRSLCIVFSMLIADDTRFILREENNAKITCHIKLQSHGTKIVRLVQAPICYHYVYR